MSPFHTSMTSLSHNYYFTFLLRKCFLKIKPLRVNIELGLVAALLPFTDVIMATEGNEVKEEYA